MEIHNAFPMPACHCNHETKNDTAVSKKKTKQTSFLCPGLGMKDSEYHSRDESYGAIRSIKDKKTALKLLKYCGNQQNLRKGSLVHADIVQSGLFQHDTVVMASLISMYAKCGALAEANHMFDELHVRDVVSWTALIAGFAGHGLAHKALSLFQNMKEEGLSPNAVTFACALKACGRLRLLKKGEEINNEVKKLGLLEENTVLGTALVDMYGKCGAVDKAQAAFDNIHVQNVVTWNALISGYTNLGYGNEALNCFQRMNDEGLSPSKVTFLLVLKACGSVGSVSKGEEIHEEIKKHGLLSPGNDIMIGTALVDMYAKCGALAKAEYVFDELRERNAVSWNALIAGYSQHDFGIAALRCFNKMLEQGLHPTPVTLACTLKACGSLGLLKKGEAIHAIVRIVGLLENNIMIGNALVDMYAKCGSLVNAQYVFDELPNHDIVSWNALISGYVHHGYHDEAMSSFIMMQNEGITPDTITYACVLKACAGIGSIHKGEEIHAELRRLGLVETNTSICNALVDMYAKCGALLKAEKLCKEMPERNVVAWNALIAGYGQHGLKDKALNCFQKMQDEGIHPDAVTYACLLNALGKAKFRKQLQQKINAKVKKHVLLENSTVLGNVLVDIYAKSGAIIEAQNVFNELPTRDIVTWNTLIAGYVQNGFSIEALKCIDKMQNEGLSPDEVTFACVLKAYSAIGFVEGGEEIYDELKKQGLLENNIVIANALVDMYAKCGDLGKAQNVFNMLTVRSIVTWTALIAGYAQVGQVSIAFESFHNMIAESIVPDMVTFVVLLNACSHSGQLEEGQIYFDIMSNIYFLIPTLEHYTCMVDLFSRAGVFDKASFVIKRLPPQYHLPLLSVLLASCRKWLNVDLAKQAFDCLVQLDPNFAPAYICMSNIYAACGMQGEADEVENLRMKNRAWKPSQHHYFHDRT